MKLIVKIIAPLILTLLFIVISGKILSVNKAIATDKLIIEGWIPFYTLEADANREILSNYDEIYFSGLSGKFDTATIQNLRDGQLNCGNDLFSNGSIYLSKKGLLKLSDIPDVKKIIIYSHDDFAFYKDAHFFVSLKDSLIGQSYSCARSETFEINGSFAVKNLGFFTIYYGNDLEYKGLDRNLYIDSVKFDNVSLTQSDDFMAIGDNEIHHCERNFPFRSNGAFLQAYLKVLGVKTNSLVIDTIFCNRNGTLAMAKGVFNGLKSKSLQNEKYNILSYNLHARRSYKVYHNLFPRENIGIIALHDINSPTSSFKKGAEYLATIIDEYASILGNYFYQ
jgi:hypothetical protein